jgi:hypothetical protein
MKNRLLLLLVSLLLIPSVLLAEENLGLPLTLSKEIKISVIAKNPNSYIGKRVLVKGMVVDVCSTRGCWMDIASDEAFEVIQIKVLDGEIVFPISARGKTALVEGVVEKLMLSYEEVLEHEKHKADEKGEKFDSSTIKKEDKVIFRIRALGAEIQ